MGQPLPSTRSGAPLADHDRGRVGVAAGDRRHDRGVADPQPLDAPDLEVGADHRQLVDAHPAGADAVVDRRRPVEDRVAQLLARCRPAPGWISSLTAPPNAAPAMISRTISDPSASTVEVVGVGEVLEVDQRRRRRVGAGQPQRAAAARVDQRGQDRHRRPRVDVVPDRLVLVGRDVGPRQQVQLQVGYVGRQRRAHERDGLEDGVRQERLARPQDLLGHAPAEEQRRAAHLRRSWRGRSARGTGGRAGCRRPAGPRARRCRGRAGAGRGRRRTASGAARSRRSRPRG